MNVTVPLGAAGPGICGVTVATNVTDCPTKEVGIVLTTVVVVGMSVDGKTVSPIEALLEA
jgi:hypothetical protein